MTDELEKQLCEKYPKIFREGFGIEASNGWYWLIDNLCAQIQHHVDQEEKDNVWKARYNEMISLAQGGEFGKFYEYYKGYAEDTMIERRATVLTSQLHNIEPVHQVKATQVKSKFACLCFYVDGGDETVHNYINFAEALSYHICERCGSTKNVTQTKKGWITSLCEDCIKL